MSFRRKVGAAFALIVFVALVLFQAKWPAAKALSAFPGEESRREPRTHAAGDEQRSSNRSSNPVQAGTGAENEISVSLGMFGADVANSIRRAYAGSLLAKRYEACRATGKPCHAELSDALYAAMASGADSFLAGHKDRLPELLKTIGPDRFWKTVDMMLQQAKDPIDRIAALTLVRRTPDLDPRRLSASAYEGLASRPDPESQLLLQNHDLLPLPDGTPKQEAYDLATDTTAAARVRTAAVLALGHEEDAARLKELVRATASEGDGKSPLSVFALPAALGKCGVGCVDTLRGLAGDSDRWQRRIAYASLTYVVDPYLRQRLEREFAALSSLSPEQLRAELAAAELPVPTG